MQVFTTLKRLAFEIISVLLDIDRFGFCFFLSYRSISSMSLIFSPIRQNWVQLKIAGFEIAFLLLFVATFVELSLNVLLHGDILIDYCFLYIDTAIDAQEFKFCYVFNDYDATFRWFLYRSLFLAKFSLFCCFIFQQWFSTILVSNF